MTKDKSTKSVAIIGLGNIGKIVAKNMVRNNRQVLIATRDFEKAKAFSTELGSLATPKETGDAIKDADIIIMAVWFNKIKELFGEYTSELQGKIIVDPSNPIAPDGKGGFVKIISEKESAGQKLSELLPKGAKLAKALGTLGAASLESAADRNPEPAVLFYATDDTRIDGEIEEVIKANGFEPLRVGGIDQSIRLEVFGDLHEFGALGKTVPLSEAVEKVYLKKQFSKQ